MTLRRCTNSSCARPYKIAQHDSPPAGIPETGRLNCPYCRHVEALWEHSAFLIHALTEEQEAIFEMYYPG